jgi:hypothetical protein
MPLHPVALRPPRALAEEGRRRGYLYGDASWRCNGKMSAQPGSTAPLAPAHARTRLDVKVMLDIYALSAAKLSSKWVLDLAIYLGSPWAWAAARRVLDEQVSAQSPLRDRLLADHFGVYALVRAATGQPLPRLGEGWDRGVGGLDDVKQDGKYALRDGAESMGYSRVGRGCKGSRDTERTGKGPGSTLPPAHWPVGLRVPPGCVALPCGPAPARY